MLKTLTALVDYGDDGGEPQGVTEQNAARLPGESQQHANERVAWERYGPLLPNTQE